MSYDGFLAENMMKRHDLLRVKASSPTEAQRSLSSSSSHHLYWARTREESICSAKGEGRASTGTANEQCSVGGWARGYLLLGKPDRETKPHQHLIGERNMHGKHYAP